MKSKRISAALCVLCALAMLLTGGCGCGGQGSGSNPGGAASGTASGRTISLVLWGSADDQKMLGEMVEDFKNQYPDKNFDITVRVNGEDVARDEALKDIDTAADVFAIANDQLGALVNANAIYENTRYADDVYETRTESSIAAATIGGKLYGYPSSSETYFLYYDSSKLGEEDVKSLEGILAVKQDSGVAKFGFDFGDAYFSSSFFLTAGCKIFGEDGQDPSSLDFNTEKGIAAAQYISKLKSQGAEDITGDVAGSRFKSGKLAAYVSGNWKAESFKEALGDNFAVAKLPTIRINDEDKDMVSFAGGKMYVVKSTTAHPVEAMDLAAFLTSESNQLKRFNQRTLLPNNKNLAGNADITSNEVMAAEYEQMTNTVATPAITQMSKYWSPVESFTKDVFDGKIASADFQNRLNTLVSDVTAS